MPRVTDEYRAARRGEIIAAAMRVVQRHGFQGASMADIIAESGLSAGAIYGHFPSKIALIHGVALEVIGARVADLREHMERDPLPEPPTLIRVLMAGMVSDLGSGRLLVQLWGEAVTDPNIGELAEQAFTRLSTAWQAYLIEWHRRRGRSATEAEEIAREQFPLYLAAAQGYIIQSALLPSFDSETYLRSIEATLPR